MMPVYIHLTKAVWTLKLWTHCPGERAEHGKGTSQAQAHVDVQVAMSSVEPQYSLSRISRLRILGMKRALAPSGYADATMRRPKG